MHRHPGFHQRGAAQSDGPQGVCGRRPRHLPGPPVSATHPACDTCDDAARLKRDIESRGREVHGALQQYHRFVKPSYDMHIKPSMHFADIVIPRGAQNTVAMDLLVKHVNAQLRSRGFAFRSSALPASCARAVNGVAGRSSAHLTSVRLPHPSICTSLRRHRSSRRCTPPFAPPTQLILYSHDHQ